MNKIFKLFKLIHSKDLRLRLELLKWFGRIVLPEYRFKWPQMAWWANPIFNKYLVKFDEIRGFNTDRRWMLYQLMRLVRNVPGDTAECGVYKGAGSYMICKVNQENKRHNRVHHIFDSFEGLSKPSEIDGDHWTKGDMVCSLETVTENLAEFNNISIHKGWIPELFSDVDSNRFCFVHIDVDLHQPTLASVEFFYPRMNEGAVILCDDYGCTTCPGATNAIDRFLQDKKEKMISLSGGGGFLIKGTETLKPLQSH